MKTPLHVGAPKSLRVEDVVTVVRQHAGVTGKRGISTVKSFIDTSDPLHGPGDDGAVVELDGARVVVCGEAIAPAFVRSDPYGAGIAAVLANVNDVAAMGGIPLAIVNTVVGREVGTREVLRGIRDAADMYKVPVVGGHLTRIEADVYGDRLGGQLSKTAADTDGLPVARGHLTRIEADMYDLPVVGGHSTRSGMDASLSAFALGQVRSPLSMAHVQPGQDLLFATCLNGAMRPDFPFFSSIAEQSSTLAHDVRLLAQLAETGSAVAAKDVSMAGALGSLAMLLEFTRCGVQVDLGRMPFPADTDPLDWLTAFPTYGFWLTAPAGRGTECQELFELHGLACSSVGTITAEGRLTLLHEDRDALLMDLASETVTGLWL